MLQDCIAIDAASSRWRDTQTKQTSAELAELDSRDVQLAATKTSEVACQRNL